MLYLFAAMVLVPLAINWCASRHDFKRFADAFTVSVMIVTFWCLTNILALVFEPPTSKMLHPVIDFIGGATCMWLYKHDRQWWKLALAGLFLAQCALHAWFWFELFVSPETRVYTKYQLTVNLSWAAELVIISWSGGRYVASLALDWMRHGPWGHHHEGVAR